MFLRWCCSVCSSVQAECCLHPLFTAGVCACVQSQLVLIPASVCHRACCRLASIKVANQRSCAGAASEFSRPLPSVIGHTQRRTKRAEAATDWREERVGSKGQKMEKQRLNHYRHKKKELTATQRQRNWSLRQFFNCFIWLFLCCFQTTWC